MTEGTIAKWHKAVGTHVAADELIVEIATDKATIEHYLPDPGWLRKILIQKGEKAVVGQPLAVFSAEEKESIAGYTPEGFVVDQASQAPTSAPAPTTFVSQQPQQPAEIQRIHASPLAKTIAAQEHLSLASVRGTGPGGRIMSRDLESVRRTAPSPAAAVTFSIPEGAKLTTLSQMRQTIGKRLQYSQSTIPHFYVSATIDVTDLVSYRESLKAQGKSVTINDFLLKATATALMTHPALRCSLFDNQLLQHEHADISLAVSIPNGLITPVIRQVETKYIHELSTEARSMAEKARAGKLLPQEYEGGAFTLTNLGMFGVQSFLAIINPPQVAILAVGSASDGPIVKNGSLVLGKTITLTVSADHRAVDGSDAAGFLKQMRELLSSPTTI